MSARASRALVALAVCLLVPPLPPVGSQTADDARPLEEIVHIDVARVRAALAAGQPVPLPLSEGELLLELAPADLFGPGYAPEPQLVRALPYAGSVRGVEGSVARLTVTELWVAGMVSRPGHPLLFVEPLERETLDSRHRVYEARDPIPHHEHPAAPAEDGLRDDPLGPGPEHDCGPLALLCVIDPNDSPGRPGTPNGPSSGTTDTSYAFSTSATDADGDLLTYEFDWGDGRRTTAGPAASGSSVSASQSWSVPRSYCVSVRATDAHGAASDWSSCRTVAIAFPPPNDCATGGDAGDAFSSASLIGPFGSIWCSADLRPSVSDTNDYYRFAVGLNRRITASVEPSTSPCVDHNLYLYDPSGNLRASSTRGGCLADSVTFDNTVSGEWRVRASAATTQDARYSLSISIGSAPNVFPPNTPSSPSPADSATGTPTSPTLSFAGGDPDGNLVVYTVYLDTSSFPTTERCSFTTASSSATCAVSGLASGTTYRWRVTAYDGANFVSGPTWRFTTLVPNSPPYAPSNPSPPDGSANRPVALTLSWTGGDPDGNLVTYTTYLDTATNPTIQRCQSTATSCVVSGLSPSTTYRWKVVGSDGSLTTTSPVWSFRTTDAPSATAPTGPAEFRPGGSGTYASTGSDPNLDALRIEFDWGDGTATTLTSSLPSGATHLATHEWGRHGRFTVRARAIDANGAVGPWTNGVTVVVNNRPGTIAPWGPSYAVVGNAYRFSAGAWDADLDALTVTFAWGDGTTTAATASAAPDFFEASHAWSTAGTKSVCVTVSDGYVTVDAGCAAIEVSAARKKIDFLAYGDRELAAQYPSTWSAIVTSYVNSMNGIYERSRPDVSLVLSTSPILLGSDFTSSTDCGVMVNDMPNQDAKIAARAETTVTFSYRDLDGVGVRGCAYQSVYTDASRYHAIVEVKWNSDASIVLTATHEVGHHLGGRHRDADHWWAWNGPHCTIMWSADPNEPSPGSDCWHREDWFSGANLGNIETLVGSRHGANVQPRRALHEGTEWGTRYAKIWIRAYDPDGDYLKYLVRWGDGTTWESPHHPSGSLLAPSHTYATSGTKTITIEAQDNLGRWGAQRTVTVTV